MTMSDRDLEDFFGEARGALEQQMVTTGRSAEFLDVVRRANALEPTSVTDDALAEARALAGVVDIRRVDPERSEDVELDAFFAEVRDAVETRVQAHRLQPIPTPRLAPRRPRRGWWVAVGSAAGLLAAAAIGWVATADLQVAAQREDGVITEQAINLGTTGDADDREAIVRRPQAAPRATEPAPPPPLVEPPPPVEPQSEAEGVVEGVDPRPETARRTESREDREARLGGLLAEAKQRWQGGDHEGATRTLEHLVRIGGRSSHVQSAYADLLVLAHQSGDEAQRQRLWRAYLRRFPHGRYADDARAGLCRSASPTRACWSDYLDDFPRGSYRAEAGRFLRGIEP